MNARQKAKYYKKRCAELERSNPPIKKYLFEVQRSPVVTLRAEQLVDMSELYKLSASEECGFSALNKMLASQFVHQILDYAHIETLPNPYGYFDKTLIRATMKVIDMRGKFIEKVTFTHD